MVRFFCCSVYISQSQSSKVISCSLPVKDLIFFCDGINRKAGELFSSSGQKLVPPSLVSLCDLAINLLLPLTP